MRVPVPGRLALLRLAPILLPLLLAGCRTTRGSYIENRARDFGEMFRVQVGGGLGLGATAQAGGLVHAGLAVALVPRRYGIGWVYGEGYAFGHGRTGRSYDGEVDYTAALGFLPLAIMAGVKFPAHWRVEAAHEPTLRPSHAEHGCWQILPCVLATVGAPSPLREGVEPPPDGGYGGLSPPDDPYGYGSPGRTWRYPGHRAGWGEHWQDHPRLWGHAARETNRWQHVHAFDIEVGVYAGLIHVRLGFSPGEMVDFVLGWFGADIAGDDRAPRAGPAPGQAPEPAGRDEGFEETEEPRRWTLDGGLGGER